MFSVLLTTLANGSAGLHILTGCTWKSERDARSCMYLTDCVLASSVLHWQHLVPLHVAAFSRELWWDLYLEVLRIFLVAKRCSPGIDWSIIDKWEQETFIKVQIRFSHLHRSGQMFLETTCECFLCFPQVQPCQPVCLSRLVASSQRWVATT